MRKARLGEARWLAVAGESWKGEMDEDESIE